MLVSTCLVLLLAPAGISLFYGGLTRKESVLNTIAMNFVSFCVSNIIWIVVGYSLAYGKFKDDDTITPIGNPKDYFLL